jgi:hypothetical protein
VVRPNEAPEALNDYDLRIWQLRDIRRDPPRLIFREDEP